MNADRRFVWFRSAGVVGVLLLAAQGLFASEPPPYGIMDLGTLPDQQESHAYGVNEAGQVAGLSGTDSSRGRAFLFTDTNENGLADAGEMIDPGTFCTPRCRMVKSILSTFPSVWMHSGRFPTPTASSALRRAVRRLVLPRNGLYRVQPCGNM